MSVLTIFNHGTGFGRDKGTARDELVAWMHNHARGSEVRVVDDEVVGRHYIINDGPGSGDDRAGTYNPYTGDRKHHEGFKYGKGDGKRSAFAKEFAGETTKTSNIDGNVTGRGWGDMVARSAFLLTSLMDQGRYIDVVNLCGWSRGAVACIRISNKLYELFGDTIRINIFGVDPVAGMQNGNTMPDTNHLPPNVDYACFVLAMHERRRTFKPQDLTRLQVVDSNITRLTYLPMPGVHNGQVIARNGLEDPAHVTRALCKAFLSHFGTRFDGGPAPYLNSSRGMVQAYARMVVSMGDFKAHQTQGVSNRGVGGGLQRRAFAKKANLTDYVRGGKAGYWINEHHRACFKRAFPRLYADIFRSGGNQLRNLNGYDRVRGEVGPGSVFIDSLMAHGCIVEMGGTLQVVQGSGVYHDATTANGYIRHWPSALPVHP